MWKEKKSVCSWQEVVRDAYTYLVDFYTIN